MRTVEVLFVIMIILTSFTIATQFAVLPSATDAFGTELGDLAQSTLETLDAKGVLSATVFNDGSDASWGNLQKALSASLPVNVVYNMTVYDLLEDSNVITYQLSNSVSDTVFGASSDAASVMVTSPDVTFTQDPQKIGESAGQEITLYVLNCSDANGWWITGYTGQSLAADVKRLLSPYFTTTVLINSTDQLAGLLQGTLSQGTIQNAVIINTFGESVPIPDDYCEGGTLSTLGYNSTTHSYSQYFHTIGGLTRNYNWTWVSIVGYPFYYVTNTENSYISGSENGYGIYGMRSVGPAGVNAFFRGLDGANYRHITTDVAFDNDVAEFTSEGLELCNYYGIYPSPYQTASRALDQSILTTYDLDRFAVMFEITNNRAAVATYRNDDGSGALTAIGLTRIPDVRVAALGLLMYYNPTVYRSEFGASGTSRLVTLQLGQQGGS